ncbi:N-acetylgalactosamine 6-sulfate sulfatase, partial [Pirellulaceae bacterium]|nr:N-acetylgalactosamine 6-sulfate sulfatase [Pirellulaceae bacterium]
EGNQRYQGFITNALIRGDWKLVNNSPFEALELYNLHEDPYEKNNLAQENPAKFNELSKSLRVQIQRGGSVPWQSPVRREVKP